VVVVVMVERHVADDKRNGETFYKYQGVVQTEKGAI